MLNDGGRIMGPPEMIEAETNGEAVAEAKRLCGETPKCAAIELWCGDRCVWRTAFTAEA
jgi:hypothetical protein